MRCKFRDAGGDGQAAHLRCMVWAGDPRLAGQGTRLQEKARFCIFEIPNTSGMRTYHDIPRPEFTPERITELKADEVFVFGSNLAGMHGGGAAHQAFRSFGAVMGCGVGLQGQSYAIPTMQGGVETIKPYVDAFIDFAKAHPELFFYVTRIGCGIAGFRDSEIAPLFSAATTVENICLPESFTR